jgi:hypothetical protein
MPDPERIAESKRRYDKKKPTASVRLPDPAMVEAVIAASTDAGMKRSEWLRQAIAEKLERERPKE